MKTLAVLVETKKGWLAKKENGDFVWRMSLEGGKVVELDKEEYTELEAKEWFEETYDLEVWKAFPTEEEKELDKLLEEN